MAEYKGSSCEAGRAKQLLKKRELELQELDNKRKKIENDLHVNSIAEKFSAAPSIVDKHCGVSIKICFFTLKFRMGRGKVFDLNYVHSNV